MENIRLFFFFFHSLYVRPRTATESLWQERDPTISHYFLCVPTYTLHMHSHWAWKWVLEETGSSPNWRLGEDTGKEESKNCSLRALLYCVFCEDEMEGRGLLSEQSLHVLPFVYTKSRARRTSLIIFLSSFYRWGKLGSKISNLPNGHSTKKAINLTWVFPTPELLYFPFLPCL